MTICENCGLAHDPDDTAACIEGHGDDPIQVTIHGKYGRGPMPVEFRDAFVEMVRLVKKGIDDGTIGKERRREAQMPAACEWPGGCANDPHHQVPDGVPIFRLTRIGSDELDGVYCRVHAQLRASQMGKERRQSRQGGTP